MENQLEAYLVSTLDEKADWVLKLERYAEENQIPIMEPLGIEFLMQLIRIHKPKRILEIGAAIGYSALRMLEAYPDAQIVTIERDKPRYEEAILNIKKLGKEDKISVMFGDALDEHNQIVEEGPYDLLFIDAAKGQYQKFFELYSEMLSEDGIIVSDNVLFKGLVASNDNTNKKMGKIASKLRSFNQWLIKQPNYKTTIVPIGDGIAISTKR